jgi:3-phosphoshikimate 1-carboxyvinyltransferase
VTQYILKGRSEVKGEIILPGSKSITNRVILLASLSNKKTLIRNYLQSDDTRYMLEALEKLGVMIEKNGSEITVHGTNGSFPNKDCELFLGNAGTAFRPLTAALAMMDGHYRLAGVQRMHERPIKDLVDSLKDLGARINYLENDGFPPLEIFPKTEKIIQKISIKGNVSSQFLTSLLISVPLLNQPLSINLDGELISKPYIDITLRLLQKFGVSFNNMNWNQFNLNGITVFRSPEEIWVEGDASSASYFFGAAAIAGKIEVHGINQESIQGDLKFLDVVSSMGAKVTYLEKSIIVEKSGELRALEVDCKMIPDAAMTLATMALFCKGTTKLINIASWKVKETDRIQAMSNELKKLGATVHSTNNTISISPPSIIKDNVTIDTYDDHRIAMCFSLISLSERNVIINNPECVNKTYPNFFKDFESV